MIRTYILELKVPKYAKRGFFFSSTQMIPFIVYRYLLCSVIKKKKKNLKMFYFLKIKFTKSTTFDPEKTHTFYLEQQWLRLDHQVT